MSMMRALVALFVLSSTAAIAEQQSLGDLARQEEQRQKSVTKPSKAYTNADIQRFERNSPGGAASSCQPEERPAGADGNQYLILRCLDGTVNEHGFNASTGSKWLNTFLPDGSQAGIRSDGVKWTYDDKTRVYRNSAGEVRLHQGAPNIRVGLPHVEEAAPPVVRKEYEPPAVSITDKGPGGFPLRPPVSYVMPTEQLDLFAARPQPISEAARRKKIEDGRVGGAIYPCHYEQADPVNCLQNGGLR